MTKRLISVLVAGLFAIAVSACHTGQTAPAGSGPEVPASGIPEAPVCPAIWTSDRGEATRLTGPLVPVGAREGLLCSYPLSGTPTQPLGDQHRTADVGRVVDYLNGLSMTKPPGEVCPGSAGTEHVIVLGYPDRAAAVVYLRRCAVDQSGQVRYGYSVKTLTGFWGVDWNK